jgi:hypothetical protein
MLIGVPGASSATDGLGHTSSSNVRRLIDEHLDEAMRRLNASHQYCVSQRTCVSVPVSQPYAGIVDHMYRISSILSKLTSALTQKALGEDISAYVIAQQRQSQFPDMMAFGQTQQDGLELQRLHNLTVQYESSLCRTGQHTGSAVESLGENSLFIENERRALPGSASPISIQSLSSMASPTSMLASPEGRNRLPNHVQARASREATNPVLSDKDHFANYNLDRWKRRGKDVQNYCPRGYECKKGGVVDGKLVLFERNSAYM